MNPGSGVQQSAQSVPAGSSMSSLPSAIFNPNVGPAATTMPQASGLPPTSPDGPSVGKANTANDIQGLIAFLGQLGQPQQTTMHHGGIYMGPSQ